MAVLTLNLIVIVAQSRPGSSGDWRVKIKIKKSGATIVTKSRAALETHVRQLRGCTICPKMHRPAVSGGPVWSRVITVGQAPGTKEPVLGRPFAWTAGKTLFGWFQRATGMSEAEFRASIYMAAVCRCFPGKNATGGDRVPDATEIANCARWLEAEIALLRPALVIPIGKLAIQQFIAFDKLTDVIGKMQRGHLPRASFRHGPAAPSQRRLALAPHGTGPHPCSRRRSISSSAIPPGRGGGNAAFILPETQSRSAASSSRRSSQTRPAEVRPVP